MGDLTLAYEPWFNQVVQGHVMLGINSDWVYPFVALLPILLAGFLGAGNYVAGWLLLQFATLVVALVFLILGGSPSAEHQKLRYSAAYFWLICLVLLGPVSISRIDFFSVAVAVMALLFVARKEKVATVLLTLAGWIKIWPIALFVALLASSVRRLKLLVVASVTTVLLLAVGYLMGGNASLAGFVGGQLGRGIQIESPWASWWLWKGVLGDSSAGIEYNGKLKTFEVFGSGAEVIAMLLGPGQLLALGITAALGFLAKRAGAQASEILTWVSTTAVLDLIFFNKVGSPQFVTWLAVPIILGLITGAPNLRPMLYLVATISIITWAVYPSTYSELLSGGFSATALLALRNVLILAALVYANLRLSKLTKAGSISPAIP
jgi:hypothetical protein